MQVTTHYSLLTTHYSPLTTHSSQLTTHNSQLTPHYSLPTTHYLLLLTTCHSPLTNHNLILTTWYIHLTTLSCRQWDVERRESVKTFEAHTSDVMTLSALATHMFVSGACDGTVRTWDVRHPNCTATLGGGSSSDVDCIQGFPGEDYFHLLLTTYYLLLTTYYLLLTTYFLLLTTYYLLLGFPGEEYSCASGSDDGTVVLWDLRTSHALRTIRPQLHGIGCTSLAFTRQGRYLMAAFSGGELRVYDVRSNVSGSAECVGCLHAGFDSSPFAQRYRFGHCHWPQLALSPNGAALCVTHDWYNYSTSSMNRSCGVSVLW